MQNRQNEKIFGDNSKIVVKVSQNGTTRETKPVRLNERKQSCTKLCSSVWCEAIKELVTSALQKKGERITLK